MYFQYHLKFQHFADTIAELDRYITFEMIVFACKMCHLDDNGWEFKLDLEISRHWIVYFQYHLNCQYFADNKGDNKFLPIQCTQAIVFVSEMAHFDDNRQEFEHGLPRLSHWKVYFQYHLKYQHLAHNEVDNRI